MILSHDESRPQENQVILVPLGGDGLPDYDPDNYRIQKVGRRGRLFFHFNGHDWVRISKAAFLLVCQFVLTEKRQYIPKNPEDVLTLFDHLVIEETNQATRKIILARCGTKVYNWHRLASLMRQGLKPWEVLDWQEPSEDWKYNIITHKAGFIYLPPESRLADDPIRAFLAASLHDLPTLTLVLLAIAHGLQGEQLAKILLVFYQNVRGTGKTLIVKVLRRGFGDYAAQMSLSTLQEQDLDKAGRELFLCSGNRFIGVSEGNRKPVNLEQFKLLVSNDSHRNRFLESSVLSYHFQGKFFFDTNRPLFPSDEDIGDLEYQTYYVRMGTPVLKKDPDLFRKLSDEKVIDTFFSNLIDEYLPKIYDPVNFQKTEHMRWLEIKFRLEFNTSEYFYKTVCVGGVSIAHSQQQNFSSREVYDIYVIFTKLSYLKLSVSLKLNLREDGTEKTQNEIFGEIPVMGYHEFTTFLNKKVGQPDPSAKNNRGYQYPNLYIKDLVIYWFMEPKVHAYYEDFIPLLEELDRIQTVEDSLQRVHPFPEIKLGALREFLKVLRRYNGQKLEFQQLPEVQSAAQSQIVWDFQTMMTAWMLSGGNN